jgi:hypothetical protein
MFSILMPSRSRPEQCEQAVYSARTTAADTLEVLVYVDEDDPDKDKYNDVIIGPPKRSAQAITYLVEHAKGDLLFMGADDMRWFTNGWDKQLAEYMPEHGLSVVVANDGRGGTPPTFTKKFYDMIGGFPDDFEHFGLDTYVVDIARKAKQLIYAPDVMVLHYKDKHNPVSVRARANNAQQKAEQFLEETEQLRADLALKIKQ